MSVPAVTRCQPFVGQQVQRLSLPAAVSAWTPSPQTDEPLCGWRKGKAVNSLRSHNIPLLNLLWERKKNKHLNRWLSNTSSRRGTSKRSGAGFPLCSGKVGGIRKILVLTAGTADKSLAVLQRAASPRHIRLILEPFHTFSVWCKTLGSEKRCLESLIWLCSCNEELAFRGTFAFSDSVSSGSKFVFTSH